MWPFSSAKNSSAIVHVGDREKWRNLIKSLVPIQGEADTWQGEVVRIVSNAEDEATRNGFINWDEEDDRDIDLTVEQLCVSSTFVETIQNRIKLLAQKIKTAGHDVDAPQPTDDEWEFLRSCTIRWCEAHRQPIKRRKDEDYMGHF